MTRRGDQRAVELKGTVTDPGTAVGETVTYHWVVTDADEKTVAQSDSLNWTFQSPDFGAYTATLTAADSNEATTSDSATLNLYNIAPTVDAGSDVQKEPLTVQLNGTVTDPGIPHGEKVASHWVVRNSEGAVVAESDDLSWTFHAFGFGTYTATLTATDEYGAATSDAAVLNLINMVPTVNAGQNTTVVPGTPVTLTGSFTDPGQDQGETYVSIWTIRNSAGLLVAAKQGSTLTFTTHTAGIYTATLSVTDSNGGVGTDTRTITVAPVLPAVNAGADVSIDLYSGQATLSGSFTDAAALPNEAYTIGWIVRNSSGTQVAAGTGLAMAYTPAAAGIYTATLSVTDSDGNTGTDSLTISVGAHFDVEVGAQIVKYLENGSADTGTITVARFVDLDWNNRPIDHFETPTINWGDGATSAGTLTYTAAWTTFKGRQVYGYYTIQGSHTYTQNSYLQTNQAYPVTVTLNALADGKTNHERTIVVSTSASINTHAPVMTSMTVNPATPELGQLATITFRTAESITGDVIEVRRHSSIWATSHRTRWPSWL